MKVSLKIIENRYALQLIIKQNVVYLHRNKTKGYINQPIKDKMTRAIKFTKMHGAGNDYIYVDTTQYPISHPEELARAWSAPHTGIGSDGLVLIGSSDKADFSMRIFNADGSEARMCGNASRCIGKYLFDYGLTSKTEIALDTLSGIRMLNLHLADGKVNSVTVDMGIPADEPADYDGTGAKPMKEQPIEVDGERYVGTTVSMGNPHLVIFVNDIEAIDLTVIGPKLENHPLFPGRINVEFAQILGEGKIRMRVWERGSGITQACGTGACATAVAAFLTGRAGRESIIIMDGGSLTIRWDIKHDYLPRGIHFGPTEVFVNDGAKSDTGNIGDILRHDNSVGVTDPIYPVYIDSNVMCGRAGVLEENGQWSNVTYMPCTAENDFIPEIPDKRIDIVYLCYPNNPTGTTLTKPELKKWVDYALANDTLILFDAAYEAFIREDDVPHSIYEIKGAKKCAIEFRSFSKTAGFTGVRCGYTVVPKELTAATLEGERIPLNKLWNRRQSTKFNGASYITQRAAEAIYTPEGQRQIKETIDYYMDNARTMKQGLEAAGLKVYGGVNAPYIWLKTPDGTSSWRFFEQMLYEANVVGTPGVGFGPSGEGYIRLTAFGKHEDCVEAMKRIRKWLK